MSYDAIDQLTAFPDLGFGISGGVDGDILYFIGALEIGVAAYPDVFDDLAILDDRAVAYFPVIASSMVEDLFREFLELFLQGLVVAEAAPQPGIAGQHAIEGNDAASTILITYFQPDADGFGFAFFEDAVAELGIVCGGELIGVDDHDVVANDVMREVIGIVDTDIVAQVAADDGAVVKTDGSAEVVKFQVVALLMPA